MPYHKCPLCAGSMKVPYVKEESEDCYLVFANQKSVKITGTRAKIFDLLWKNIGRGVVAHRIITNIWQYDPPDGYLNTLKVHKHKLKQSLEGTGLTIVCLNKARYGSLLNAEGTVYCLLPVDSEAAAKWGIKHDNNAALLRAMEVGT